MGNRLKNEIEDIITQFDPVGLEEAESVQLFNRVDQKYIFHAAQLEGLLGSLKSEYDILAVNGYRNQPYRSLYFDTAEHAMYYAHHNGHLNRYKIRFREYRSSRLVFLEIKFKSNQDRTIKKRQAAQAIAEQFGSPEGNFLASNTIYAPGVLLPQVWTNFNRITLIHKNRKERLTLDTELEWIHRDMRIALSSLVIIEVKRQRLTHFPVGRMLQQAGYRPTGISKYSIGSAMLNRALRTNMFKTTLISIKKICQDELPSIASAGIHPDVWY